MATPRAYHTATALPDGRVLLTGGFSGSVLGGRVTAGAELFDPATGLFTPAPPMSAPRYRHAAALLPDGRVLVTGGWSGRATLVFTELYDPATGLWTAAEPMRTRRSGHTMTLLPDSTLLVVGGRFAAEAERFDPATRRFLSAGPLTELRQGHTATLLPDGEVLVAGGYVAGALNSAERFALEMLAP
jgi:hypothetical protein